MKITPLPKPGGQFSGYFENSVHTGEAAADLLVAMIQRGERVILSTPHRLHFDGIWFTGRPCGSKKPQRKPANRKKICRRAHTAL